MLKSPLEARTRAQGAKFSPYFDWEMPAHYGQVEAEYRAARTGAVLRDASHWSRLHLSGADHLDFLQRMSTNDFAHLQPGAGLEAILPDHRGRILELGTFHHAVRATLAILSPQGRHTIPAWFERYIFAEQIAVEDLSTGTAMLEVLGPGAGELVSRVLGVELEAAAPHALLGDPAREEALWLLRLEGWGPPGLRLCGPPPEVAARWKELEAAGGRPMGEEAGEILRVEQGLPLWGRELSPEHNPWEAGLARAIHMDKGCYIGQEIIARLHTYDKVKQRLVGLELAEGALPAPGAALRSEGRDAGRLSSAVHSPRLGRNIALAYVRRAFWAPGTLLQVRGEEGEIAARVAALPFDLGA